MIGIDVGGANLKVVDDAGVHIRYCPLWEGAPLTEILRQYRSRTDSVAAVVMSGELADCFSSKKEGVSFIVSAVRAAFPGARFYGTDGKFHSRAIVQLAAANWLASAGYLCDLYPDAVLLDVGSTTTDIIPLTRFSDLTGLTDLARLQNGYLLYTGMLRTTLPALLRTVEIDGKSTPVSSEYFAISADAHLVLKHINPALYTCDTPDRKGKARTAALRRLARVVCADLDEIGRDNAEGIARQFWDVQKTRICDTARDIMHRSGASEIVTAGIGADLFARELGGHTLRKELGAAADALPAFAVREIARHGQGRVRMSRSKETEGQ
jgi:probable H4MPT-linked C1 transfer pathway protein